MKDNFIRLIVWTTVAFVILSIEAWLGLVRKLWESFLIPVAKLAWSWTLGFPWSWVTFAYESGQSESAFTVILLIAIIVMLAVLLGTLGFREKNKWLKTISVICVVGLFYLGVSLGLGAAVSVMNPVSVDATETRQAADTSAAPATPTLAITPTLSVPLVPKIRFQLVQNGQPLVVVSLTNNEGWVEWFPGTKIVLPVYGEVDADPTWNNQALEIPSEK